mmetsp:Transcript_22806/g.53270  ORF Transcript_22806/g.53270 Transcript_22806/m.53270 type:complete len:119 (-) Transcript_22806:233-589(-)
MGGCKSSSCSKTAQLPAHQGFLILPGEAKVPYWNVPADEQAVPPAVFHSHGLDVNADASFACTEQGAATQECNAHARPPDYRATRRQQRRLTRFLGEIRREPDRFRSQILTCRGLLAL